MKNNKPGVDNAVLTLLQALEELPLPEALRTLQRIIELLRAAQIAAETGEALARLVQLHNHRDTPALEQVLSALLDVKPDCRAAAGIAAAALKIKLKQSEPPTASIQ